MMAILKNIILKTELILHENTFYNPSKAMNITFGIDANFSRPMGVTMTSILLNHRNENIIFHVFTDGIHIEDKQRLQELVNKFPVVIKLYYIDRSVFSKLQSTLQWSIATYYRFIMGQALYGEVETILYLDADIICLGSLKGIFSMNLQGKTIGAVADVIDAYHFPIRMKKINITSGKYFNAGVLYIDIRQWHDKDISERALQELMQYPEKYDYLDQDVLNVLLENDIQFIDKTYNYLYNMEKETSSIPNNVKLLHYATRQKPWHLWCIHPLTKYFDQYAAQSPWKDVPAISQPRNYKEMKMLSKMLWKNGCLRESVYWYCCYCKKKILKS